MKIRGLLLILLFAYQRVLALPSQGTVVSGSANISTPTSTSMQIQQSTNQAILNWQSFNIANNESVQFLVPNSGSATLNRVTGNDPSEILGSLSSNGQVWLINANGIMFGQNAQVNVAGLMASTLDIANQNFMNGNDQLTQSGATLGQIVNQGSLNANSGGYITLLAPQINNTGIISANLGTVALAAGTAATVQLQGNHLLNIAVTNGADIPMYDENGNPVAALNNSGKIMAAGGKVLITAQSVNTLLNESINMSGIVKANSVREENGDIVISGAGNVIVNHAKLRAVGKHKGQTGGSVIVIGQNVALINNTSVNVNGAAGGGDIHIGKDEYYPYSPEAIVTYIDANTILTANATQNGNGGFIETSGENLEENSTHVSTLGAGDGQMGTWLLDPYDIEITNGQADSAGGWNGGNTIFNSGNSAIETSYVNTTTLDTNLANNNVTIQTGGSGDGNSGNITVASTVDSLSSTHLLTLQAAGSITVDAGVSISVGKSLALDAGGGGAGNITIDGTLETGTGAGATLTVNAYNYSSLDSTGTITLGPTGSINVPGTGTSTLIAGAGIDLQAGSTVSNVNNGTMNFNADEVDTNMDGIVSAGTITNGKVTLQDNSLLFSPGTVAVTESGNVTFSSTFKVKAATGDIAQPSGSLTGTDLSSVTLESYDGNIIQGSSAGISTPTLFLEAGNSDGSSGIINLAGANNQNINTINLGANVINTPIAFSLYDGGVTTAPILNNAVGNTLTYSSFAMTAPAENEVTSLNSMLNNVFNQESNPSSFDLTLVLPGLTTPVSLGDGGIIDPAQEETQQVDNVSLTTGGQINISGFSSNDALNNLTAITSDGPIDVNGDVYGTPGGTLELEATNASNGVINQNGNSFNYFSNFAFIPNPPTTFIPAAATSFAANPVIISDWVNENVEGNIPHPAKSKTCIKGMQGEQICSAEMEHKR